MPDPARTRSVVSITKSVPVRNSPKISAMSLTVFNRPCLIVSSVQIILLYDQLDAFISNYQNHGSRFELWTANEGQENASGSFVYSRNSEYRVKILVQNTRPKLKNKFPWPRAISAHLFQFVILRLWRECLITNLKGVVSVLWRTVGVLKFA